MDRQTELIYDAKQATVKMLMDRLDELTGEELKLPWWAWYRRWAIGIRKGVVMDNMRLHTREMTWMLSLRTQKDNKS